MRVLRVQLLQNWFWFSLVLLMSFTNNKKNPLSLDSVLCGYIFMSHFMKSYLLTTLEFFLINSSNLNEKTLYYLGIYCSSMARLTKASNE